MSSMSFEIDISLRWVLCSTETKTSYDHCWHQSKTLLWRDNVIIKLVFVIK